MKFKHKPIEFYQDYEEEVPPNQRRKGSKRKMLTQEEKLSIVHKVLVQFENQTEVAKEFRIRIATVSNLVNKFKKDENKIGQLFNKRDNKANQK